MSELLHFYRLIDGEFHECGWIVLLRDLTDLAHACPGDPSDGDPMAHKPEA
jgi:hypothetical protein